MQHIGYALPLSLSFPAGHSVSYLEHMTHIDADHWQNERESDSLKNVKITKPELDPRLMKPQT